MGIRKARFIDYFNLQGGVPQIHQDEKTRLWHIKHAYLEDEREVVTHISPAERGTVIINNVEFDVAKLWRFEGAPCEGNSQRAGGETYDRKSGFRK